MKFTYTAGAAALMALMLAGPTFAQTPSPDHHGHAQTPAAPAATAADLTDGEVRRIDAAASKLTIKHGEIKHLDMPPMTMVFEVREPALLQGVQAGDAVRFTADKIGGRYTVTSLERLPAR